METYKVLGQVSPTATTNTDLYQVPAGNSAICSTLAIANRGVSTTFRVAVRPGNVTLSNVHYIVYDSALSSGDSLFLTLGISLATTDVLTVYAGTNTLSFSLFGMEIS